MSKHERIKFFSDGAWISFRYGVVAGTGFILSILFARLAPKETYGMYQYIISIVSMVSIISLPGLVFASLKSVVAGEDGAVARSVKMSFLWSLIGAIFLIIYGVIKIEADESDLGLSFVLSGILLPFFYSTASWYAYYYGRKIYRPVEIRLIVSSLVLFLLLGIALFLKLGIIWLIAIFFGGTSLFTGLYFLHAKKKYAKNAIGEIRFRFALAVTGQKFVLNAAENIPIILVGSIFGYAATALYQVAYFPVATLSGYLGALLALRLPDFFNGKTTGLKSMIFHNTIGGILLFLIVVFFLKFLFLLVYGVGYKESVDIAWVIAPLVIFLPLKTHLINFFSAQEKNKEVVMVYVIANFIAVLLFVSLRSSLTLVESSALLLYSINVVAILLLLALYPFIFPKKKTGKI